MEFDKQKIESYLDLVAVKRVLSGYEKIAEIEDTDKQVIKKEWSKKGGINGYIAHKLKLDLEELGELSSIEDVVIDKEKIDKLFNNQYTEKRKEGFGTFEMFYTWYKEQGDRCYYCKTDSNTLNQLFNNKKLKSSKFNATLHIERLRPKEPYNTTNCRLACSLCNNAKSDLISNENFEKYFSNSMRAFLCDLSDNVIANRTTNNNGDDNE